MTMMTDTLHVKFPSGIVSAEDANAQLQAFGDISHFEMLDDLSTAVVSYYDLRCAAKALASLGDLAKYQDMRGDRIVWVFGETVLDEDVVDSISAISPDPDIEGSFFLQFYDTRAATKALDMSDEACYQAAQRDLLNNEAPPGLDLNRSAAMLDFAH
jgi:hypothetical protein